MPPKGKKKEKKSESKERKKKPKERDPLPWEDDRFPKMAERKMVQATVDPAELAKMRAKAKKKMMDARGEDPATLERRFKVHVALTAIENHAGQELNVFCAVTQADAADKKNPKRSKNKLHQKFAYTKSYKCKPGDKKVFSSMELVMDRMYNASYKGLQRQEISADVWIVSDTNFNQLLGTAAKDLYEIGCDSVFQNMLIRPAEKGSFDVGIISMNAICSEVLHFKISASNWRFQPRPDLHDDKASKAIRIDMPTGPDAPRDAFQTSLCPGPRYSWAAAGEYVYQGTKVSLQMEAITISVYSDSALQGKAIVSLGTAGEYPIAMGVVKAMSNNPNQFVQGRVGGNIAVKVRSVLLDDDVIDEESSIPPPMQPTSSLVMFHLSAKLQYLVVELYGADGLPVADTDIGTSHPFVRCKWDNLVQQSPVCEATLSPTWNHKFYMPVRVTDEQLRTNKEYYKTLLPIEMKSKGLLELEVWHFDSVPTEFLGKLEVELQNTLIGKQCTKAVIDSAKMSTDDAEFVEEEEEDDANVSVGIHPLLTKKQQTRSVELRREGLKGSQLQSMTRSTLSAACYFLPDFPAGFKYPVQGDDEEEGAKGQDPMKMRFSTWNAFWGPFQEAYLAWFPDAPAGRRFLCHFDDQGHKTPLPMLIAPLALPSALASPMSVVHWIKCLEFSAPARQRSCGQIGNWTQPEDILALRRGSAQDHAVLLCCALLGLGKNAFVCKGTIQGGLEHCWVMTREVGGVVTFWEPMTAAKYHLPNRWLNDYQHGDASKKKVEDRWSKRNANGKWRKQALDRQKLNRPQHLKYMDDLVKLPISPARELYKSDDDIVAIPYETIEIVFNSHQLWGNISNHHPGCIYYDMEDDERSWMTLIGDEQRSALGAGKIAIPVGPPVAKNIIQQLEDGVEAELKESVRMIRMRQGQETFFEDDEVLQTTLEHYLQFLEEEGKLDSDWCYDEGDKLKKPWGCPSPFASFTYVQGMRKDWAGYWKKRDMLEKARKCLPVKENHVLSGIPLNFSSCDLKELRKNILHAPAVEEYFTLESDDAIFFVCAKVFPLPSGVCSTWLFFGAEIPLPPDKVLELVTAQMKEWVDEDENASKDSEAGDKEIDNPLAGKDKDGKGKKGKPTE